MGVSGHEFAKAAFDATIAGVINIKDPGTGGTLSLGECSGGVCELTIAAAAETRTLPTASSFKTGVEVTVVANQITTAGTHYCTVNGVVLATEGDYAVFKTMLINDAMTWKAIAIPPGLQSNSAVALAVSTTLLAPLHANRVLRLGGAGSARTMTLPAPTGTGNSYFFEVGAVNTSGYIITAANTGHLLEGTIQTYSAGDTAFEQWISLISDAFNIITLNGTTKGGTHAGDWVEVIDVAADRWMVRGHTQSSGTIATPFSQI